MMIKNPFVLLLLALPLLLVLPSCGDDDDPSDSITLDPFTSIVITDDIVVEFESSTTRSVVVQGPGDLSEVRFNVTNEVLTISGNGDNRTVLISYPGIDSFALRNNAEVTFENTFISSSGRIAIEIDDAGILLSDEPVTAQTMACYLSNAGQLALTRVAVSDLTLDLRDGSRCNIGGTAIEQNIAMTNGCRFNLDFPISGWNVEPVQGGRVNITVDNGANGWIYATDFLSATGRNGSRVFHVGEPAVVESDMTGGSELIRKDD